jgi:hypothetical protein
MPRRSDAVAIACAALLVPLLASAQAPIRVVGPLPGIFRTPENGCASRSRTLVATSSQYFINADGGHASLEAGANVDTTLMSTVRQSSASGTQYLLYNGGIITAVPGLYVYLDTGRLRSVLSAGGSLYTDVGATVSAAGSFHVAWAVADRDGVLDLRLDGVDDDATPADISAQAAQSLANSHALVAGAYINGTSPVNGRAGIQAIWVGTAVSDANSLAISTAILAGTMTCSTLQTTYGATACWPMTGAAGANEADQIGSVTLTQVNSPGSADGPGLGCN